MQNQLSAAAGGRMIGYARVSTEDQKLDLQIAALKAAECDMIVQEKVSGTVWTRKGLDRAVRAIRPGDRLVVWRLDRLGRSIVGILSTIAEIENAGGSLISLAEGVDSGTEQGEMLSTLLAMVAHIERRMIVSRTKAGLAAARARGVKLGPKPKMTAEQIAEAKALIRSGTMKAEAAGARFNVSRATIYRNLKVAA